MDDGTKTFLLVCLITAALISAWMVLLVYLIT